MNTDAVELFYSYAHEDETFRKKLEKHLSVLKNQGVIREWHDRKIVAGSDWEEQIDGHLNSSRIILLLVSSDFLASNYITSVEVTRAMERHEAGEARVVPVILRPCLWDGTPFAKLQGLPKDGKPVTEWSNRENAFSDIARGIRSVVEELKKSVDADGPVKIKETPLVMPDPIPALGIFIDRVDVIDEIRRFFHEDVGRLIVLQGFPGMGKTTLAARLSGLIRSRVRAVLWFKCHPDRLSSDVLFAKFHAFFEENEDHSLRGIWNDMNPGLFDVKINRLIRALDSNRYLIVFDEFENWLGDDFRIKNEHVKKVLSDIFCAAHKSKFILVSHKRPAFEPLTIPLPFGSMKEHTVLGLSEPYAIQLLRESGLDIEDEELMGRIVNYCDGNPLLLQMFSYQVRIRRRDPGELIEAGAKETKFANLLREATSGLSRESRRELERLSVFRLPLSNRRQKTPGVHYNTAVEPLVDRFLVISGESIDVPIIVKNFMLETLSESRRLELHKEAAAFYKQLHGDRTPRDYETLQSVLEEAYHRFQGGDNEHAATIVMPAVVLLVDWGYIEQAEQQALQVEHNVSDNHLLAQCAGILGRINDLRSNYTAALEYFENALELYISVNDHGGAAGTMFRIGSIYNALRQFKRADTYFQRCIEHCDKHGVNEKRGGALLSMAWNRKEQAFETGKVLELYRSSLEYAEKEKDYITVSSAHRQIGFLLWSKRQNKEEALRHYEQALRISRSSNLVKEIGAIHVDLGYLHNEWGEYSEAGKNCLQAIEILKALGNNYALGNAYCNFAGVMESTGMVDNAVRYYELSIKISSEIKNFGCTAYAALRLGMVHQKQNNLGEAKKRFLEADLLCREYGLNEIGNEVKNRLNKLKKLVSQSND